METILVQETDAATLEVLTAALQMEGFQVCSPAGHDENIMETIRPAIAGMPARKLFGQAGYSLGQITFPAFTGSRFKQR